MRLGLLHKQDDGDDLASEEELKALRRLAEDRIKTDLEAQEGTAAVKVSGGLEDEIQIPLLTLVPIPMLRTSTCRAADSKKATSAFLSAR